MIAINFVIPGRIGGKGRHRSVIMGGTIRTYTPGKTVNEEATVKWFAYEAMRSFSLLRGPLGLVVKTTYRPPRSWSMKKQRAAHWITGKPDCDNTIKLIGDALNGVVWKDDSQIAYLSMTRNYSLEQNESVDITITELTL
jgi:Holliday junction resolvase RusA-like endonuclease